MNEAEYFVLSFFDSEIPKEFGVKELQELKKQHPELKRHLTEYVVMVKKLRNDGLLKPPNNIKIGSIQDAHNKKYLLSEEGQLQKEKYSNPNFINESFSGEKPTAIHQLDSTLKVLYGWDESRTFGFVVEQAKLLNLQLSNQALELVLQKLIKDGYATGQDTRSFGTAYGITFEGKVFYEFGGYKQKEINDGAEKKRVETLESYQLALAVNQITLANRLNFLTGWVAGGTIALALIGLLSIAIDHNWFCLK